MSKVAADAVGVNTHLNYLGSVYDIHYHDIIKPALIGLGTKHIRDHLGNEKINSRYTELAHQNGIKLLVIHENSGTDLIRIKNEIKRLNSINPAKPVVDLIEPANESDIDWKYDWAKLCRYMQAYRDNYKTDSTVSALPLLGPSFANTRSSAVDFSKACANVSATMDLGNLHAYSGLFPESPLAGGWGISFDKAIAGYRTICKDKPIIESESGYKMSEGAEGHPAVSERIAAKYAPRLVLERLRQGVSRLYFYQLINNAEDFGMLNEDGSPRLQYTALKNFIHLMNDPGGDFKTTMLNYSLSGNVTNIRQMLFQKRDGKFLLIMWQGINGSTRGTKDKDYKDVENTDLPIQLTLQKKAKSINVYRPTFNHLPDGNGTEPLITLRNKSVINLKVPDHLLIAELSF